MQRLLDDFNEITEIDIKATLDTINSDSEKYAEAGAAYIMAIHRCRKVLEIILRTNKNERIK